MSDKWECGTPRSTDNAFHIETRIIVNAETKHEREKRLDRESYLRRKLAGLLKPTRTYEIPNQADSDKSRRIRKGTL